MEMPDVISLHRLEPHGSRIRDHTAHAGRAAIVHWKPMNQNLTNNKQLLRASIREQRRALSRLAQQQAAKALAEQLQNCQEIRQAKTIGMYVASDGEIDLAPIMHWCWERQIDTVAPIVESRAKLLKFAYLERDSTLVKNRLGILEPELDDRKPLEVGMLDVLLMPLVAFDDNGNRLGMGGGFYDATLRANQQAAGRQPLRVGAAHELQRTGQIDSDPWDVPLDMLATEQCIRYFAKPQQLQVNSQ